MTMEDGNYTMWNNWAKKRFGMSVFDNWLDKYENLLEEHEDGRMLDLGCGNGADTRYLLERDYNVISCDFADNALENVKRFVKNSSIKKVDMTKELPFEDGSFGVVVADLSLHYFDFKTTKKIIAEIQRVLNSRGVLFARVVSSGNYQNPVKEIGYEIEKNYYWEGEYAKRLFNKEDVEKFFGVFSNLQYEENEMTRDDEEYRNPRKVFALRGFFYAIKRKVLS